VTIIAASPAAGALYTEADFNLPCAIVVGSEDAGLGPEWRQASDLQVGIPMKGSADSLNVSVTAAILLYEALRQRKAP
jgi:TrmH family RNA methyltransferase